MARKHMGAPSDPVAAAGRARGPHRALIVDFGGVLTTSIWPAFAAFCESEDLAPDAVRDLFRGNGRALGLLRGLETGELADADFERGFAELLGIAEHEGLIGRMFAGLAPDERMVDAVRAARDQGVATGLITNSFGLGIYDRAPIELFDASVISGEVGMHKPQPEIYLLACERLKVAPADAVFVDDLRENCEGAAAVGMTAVRHRDAATTVPRLERLLGVELTRAQRSR